MYSGEGYPGIYLGGREDSSLRRDLLFPHFSQRMAHWKPHSQYKTNSETGVREASAGHQPTVKRVSERHRLRENQQ